MRIIANSIFTKWEMNLKSRPQDSLVKLELSTAIANKLREYDALFFKEEIEQGTEYRYELFVFSRDTVKTLMQQLRGILSEEECARVKNIFINGI